MFYTCYNKCGEKVMRIHLIISESYYFIKQTLDEIYGDFSNVVKINYNDSLIDDVLYEFSSVSLFDEKKYVVVENAEEIFSKSFDSGSLTDYLENPSEITTVIFVTKKVEKTNKYYKKILKDYKVYDNTEKKKVNLNYEIKSYLKKHNSNMTDKAINYIKEACLNNYDLILREIDKLLILGKNNISDELVYGLVSLTPDGNNNRFINALMEMNEKEALICVENMKILNIDISKLIALIAWNVRVTYLIKKYRKNQSKLEEVLKLFNISDYAYNKFVRNGNIRSEEELENLIIFLADIDISLKTYEVDKDNIGNYLINMFCI